MGFGVDVRLRQAQSKGSRAAERRDTLEDCVRQRLLQVPAARRGDFLNLGAEEIIVPCARRIVAQRRCEVVQPDLDRDEQALRRADFKLVETDVRLHLQRVQKDACRADLQMRRDQAQQFRLARAHSRSRNWTSLDSAMKRCPESIVSTWPVTALAPSR